MKAPCRSKRLLLFVTFALLGLMALWMFDRMSQHVLEAEKGVNHGNQIGKTTLKNQSDARGSTTTNSSTILSTTTKTLDNNNQATDDEKWLLYFAESGWSNQLRCLENAFYIARKLQRGMILPPVLPHWGKGYRIPRDIFSLDSRRFKTNTPIAQFYTWKKYLPREKYVPMHHVLDVDYSLLRNHHPQYNVPKTMDAMEFFALYKNKTWDPSTLSKYTLEKKYDHFNTKWMYHRDDLEGKLEVLEHKEYRISRVLNMTYRDISKALNQNQSAAKLLTFLDTFKTQFDTASMIEPPFRPRLSKPIREAAQTIQQGWKVDNYASVHIRGADTSFKDPAVVNASITAVMDQITVVLQEWMEEQPRRTSTSMAKTNATVGLFVATDMKNLRDHSIFQEKTRHLVHKMEASYHILLTLLWGPPFAEDDPLRKQVLYPDIFMDQQLAACATIGFVGTSGSTFSGIIRKLRHEEAC